MYFSLVSTQVYFQKLYPVSRTVVKYSVFIAFDSHLHFYINLVLSLLCIISEPSCAPRPATVVTEW